MLRAPLLRRRGICPAWSGRESFSRAQSHGHGLQHAQHLSTGPGRRPFDGQRQTRSAGNPKEKQQDSRAPSLIEQLFPEESKKYTDAQARKERQIPRLPLEIPKHEQTQADRFRRPAPSDEPKIPPNAARARKMMQEQAARAGQQTSVLVMLDASKNLTIEDFRRLIPQGAHMEGWTLEEGDILKVIPGRNLATLAQENFYYLLFSSPLSAFVYQGHATRISRLAISATPNSLHNALAPGPGYIVNGMDAHAAVQAYTLTPPMREPRLRQLKPPLSPLVDSIVSNGGYSAIVNRPDKMPYEVRLTLEGPQIPMSRVRSVLHASGRDRALEWSGGHEANLKITKYEPQSTAFDQEDPPRDPSERTEHTQLQWDMNRARISSRTSPDDETTQRRRKAAPVYIIGFHTELAAQSFIRHWHRRPMSLGREEEDEEGDLPPVANVELLW